ncbi:MAG TPA: DUF4388 domain-containing protein [Polyangiaceae bacterium]
MLSSVPWADAQAGASAGLDASAVVELLDQVEQLPSGATGALLVGPRAQPCGSVLVENGRVCWAMANGMKRRMTDLLRYQALTPLDPAQIEDVYKHCRARGIALGEALVESGIVSPDGLRRALRQHTAEAMERLSLSTQELSWVEHRKRAYDARFTFVPGEILVGLVGLRMSVRAAHAQATLRLAVDVPNAGAAFARVQGAAFPLPVAATGMETLPVRELVGIGRWAMDTLDLAGAFEPERRLVGAVADTGRALLTWLDEGLVYVAVCEDPSEFACALVKLRRTHRSAK